MEEEKLTLETLPKAFTHLSREVGEIKKLLLEKSSNAQEPDRFLSVREVGKYLRLSPATIYGLVLNRRIPHQKRGNRLYFLKSEIDDWIKAGRRRTVDEMKEAL